jgi:hypothetical protein
VVLSTALEAEATHWRHTVLWLTADHRRALSLGDTVEGSVRYSRRGESGRDYCIEVKWTCSSHPTQIFSQAYMLVA